MNCCISIASRAVKLRPQVAVWEREIPKGEGITGLWRSKPAAAEGFRGFGGAAQVFTFRQGGTALSGMVEGGGRGFGGGEDREVEIEEGKVVDGSISFKAGNVSYTGTVKGAEIELQRTGGRGRRGPVEPPGTRPEVGPPPDGSDPSSGAFFGLGRGGRGMQAPAPVTLERSRR